MQMYRRADPHGTFRSSRTLEAEQDDGRERPIAHAPGCVGIGTASRTLSSDNAPRVTRANPR